MMVTLLHKENAHGEAAVRPAGKTRKAAPDAITPGERGRNVG
jgi:hypothetical protein